MSDYNARTPISEAQERFVRSLLGERLATLGFTSVDDAAEAMNLHNVSKYDASVIINRLKSLAKDPDPTMPEVVKNASRNGTGNRPGACAGCGHPVPAGAGFYFLKSDGRWAVHHKVSECIATPAPAPVQVEKGIYMVDDQIVLVYLTGNRRLAGKVWTGRSYRYQQGAVNLAAMGRKITAAEAAAFGATTGCCVACARDLTDERSVQMGYGPVCAANNGWPWGVAATV